MTTSFEYKELYKGSEMGKIIQVLEGFLLSETIFQKMYSD